MMMMGSSSDGRHSSLNSRHRVGSGAPSSAHMPQASTSNEQGSSNNHKQVQQKHHHQQQHRHALPSTITTLASPTSSASSSICSSPPSSSSCSSSCSECDDEAQAQQASLLQVSNDEGGRHPSNSTSMPSSSCRHGRHTGHHHHHHHRQHTSHSSLSNSGHQHHHHHHSQAGEQQLFSPITSNGSVISTESSSKSRPSSPLKSSVGSILPSAEQDHPATRANVRQPEATLTDGTDKATAGTVQEKGVHNTISTASSTPDMVVDDAPSTSTGSSTDATQQDAPPSSQRPPSNPRKSARRHSENGMKTPDESLYSSTSTYLPFSSTSSIPLPSSAVKQHQQDASSSSNSTDTFIAPSMYSRTASTPASSVQYQHPGTPAITGSHNTSNAIANQQTQASVPLMIRNPGERRIPNEETRPARRKVHRIDTSSISSSNATTSEDISRQPQQQQQGRSYSTPALSRKLNDRMPSNKNTSTTFLHQHPRPSPHSDSYFPQSSSQVKNAQSSNSRSNLSNTTTESGSNTGYPARDNENTSTPAVDHHKQQQQQAQLDNQRRAIQGRIEEDTKLRKLRQVEKLKERESNMEHMDIANYPTLNLLQSLASLLSEITMKNDAIRDGLDSASSPSSSIPSSSASSSRDDANSNGKEDRGAESSQDERMEGHDDDGTEQQQDETAGTGTVTPPSQIYSHSRNTSNEPVTPAVPFSSPALSRETSSTSHDANQAAASGEEGQRKEKDAFEHDSRLTVSTAEARAVSDNEGGRKSARSGNKEEEDTSYQPRHNFYRPPTSSSSSYPGSTITPSFDNFPSQTEEAATPHHQRKRSHAILTSAANALAMPNATLCFHARNIPSISIEAYLVRISKYCPTTNEVFISLLVYFDRMSRLPNLSNLTSSLPSASMSSSASNNTSQVGSNSNSNTVSSISGAESSRNSNNSSGHPSSGIANADRAGAVSHTRTRSSSTPPGPSSSSSHPIQHSQHSTFAVDSFNIHRLIIAGVTVASKFFSDVFYTNSRYAKVGGLPLTELNALELQFLLLNGFDLIVSPEELQRYADYLLIGALPPLASDTSDRFGSRPGTSCTTRDGSGKETITPVDTPPSSRANTPSKSGSKTPSNTSSHNLFGLAMRRNMMQQQDQQAITTGPTNSAIGSNPSFASHNGESTATLRSTIMDNTTRPKTSSRSASESSTSASEASTVVPSESSVDTERGEIDHSTADEDTGVDDDDDEIDGDSRMTDVSGAPSPAVTSQSHSFSQYQDSSPKFQQKAYQKESLPMNATLGADRDGFAIPARPRPPLSRSSSGGNGQRHPLLATSTGSRTPSNGGSSGGHSSGGRTSAATSANQNINVKSNAGKTSTTKGSASMHRRDNSRTREWTMQQQQQMHLHDASSADEDAEMADQE